MKQILTLLISLATLVSNSQNKDFEKPNYTIIEKDISDSLSNLYYTVLMERYQKSDTTLTLDERRHLYYGYSFHPNYSPYSRSDFSDSLRIVLKKKKHTEKDIEKIIEFGDSILVDHPFDLRTINYQLYAYEQKENKEKFKDRITKMNIVIDALISSGNGTSKKNAFYVIYTSHEYNLLNILGYEYGGTQRLIQHYDHLSVSENEKGLEGLYFDVSPCLNSLSNMFKE